ncbi:hypothetical protein T08_5506 [Trichinella sp. T8]|nr:hypothetical protein T08_6085 [Trichinella sp. T8]KRZ97497.1 hypothetical protein T08_5506 [Trichinella sp. T8]
MDRDMMNHIESLFNYKNGIHSLQLINEQAIVTKEDKLVPNENMAKQNSNASIRDKKNKYRHRLLTMMGSFHH